MPAVLTGTPILKKSLGSLGQAKGIVKLPIREKLAVRSNLGTMKFQLQAAVKIDPQSAATITDQRLRKKVGEAGRLLFRTYILFLT